MGPSAAPARPLGRQQRLYFRPLPHGHGWFRSAPALTHQIMRSEAADLRKRLPRRMRDVLWSPKNQGAMSNTAVTITAIVVPNIVAGTAIVTNWLQKQRELSADRRLTDLAHVRDVLDDCAVELHKA